MANTIVINETPRYSLSVSGDNELQLTLNGPAGPVGPTGAAGPVGPTGAAGSSVTVDATIIDGSANAVAGNAVFDALALKAPLASPTFTGTVSGITKSMVGLGNVDNTTDANKPVSTAQQTALDLKANLISPSFTGQVTVTSTGSTDGIYSQAVSGKGVFGFSDTGSGVFASSTSGYGLYATSYDGNGAYVTSNGATALIATTNAGLYHATFGSTSINQSFIARVKGAFGWIRGEFTARIHPTDTITADRTYTLPNKDGTVAMIDAETHTGAHAFSSTTRPTSGGTGTPEATSLITRADGDARFSQVVGASLTAGVDSDVNTTTYKTVTELSFALGVGTYYIDAILVHNGNASYATSGTKDRLNFSGTATASGSMYRVNDNATTSTSVPNSRSSTNPLIESALTNRSQTTWRKGVLTVTAAGTLSVQIAQNVAVAAANTTLATGSSLIITRLI